MITRPSRSAIRCDSSTIASTPLRTAMRETNSTLRGSSRRGPVPGRKKETSIGFAHPDAFRRDAVVLTQQLRKAGGGCDDEACAREVVALDHAARCQHRAHGEVPRHRLRAQREGALAMVPAQLARRVDLGMHGDRRKPALATVEREQLRHRELVHRIERISAVAGQDIRADPAQMRRASRRAGRVRCEVGPAVPLVVAPARPLGWTIRPARERSVSGKSSSGELTKASISTPASVSPSSC